MFTNCNMPKNANNRNISVLEEVLSEGGFTGDYSITFPNGQDVSYDAGLLRLTGVNGVPTSTPDEGSIVYDQANNDVYVYDGVSWNLVGGGATPDLEAVLTAGNTTGSNSISINSGFDLLFAGGDVQIPASLNVANVSIGYLAGDSLTIGEDNVLIGTTAGDAITSANYNVCIGNIAGSEINTGSRNICIGYSTATGLTIGTDNICIGHLCKTESNNDQYVVSIGYNTSADSQSIAIGYTTTANGANAVAIGGLCSATQSRSTSIGYNADATGTNAVAIGYNSAASGSSSVMIGTGTNAFANSVKMAPTSNVFVDSVLKVSDTIINNKVPSIDIGNSDFTLSSSQVINNLMSVSGLTANRTVTFPTGTNLSAVIPDIQQYDMFTFYISNEDSTFNINLASNTGCTFIGGSPRTIGPNRIATCLIYFITTTSYQVRFTSIESY